jgi:hypothetical protein
LIKLHTGADNEGACPDGGAAVSDSQGCPKKPGRMQGGGNSKREAGNGEQHALNRWQAQLERASTGSELHV